MTTTYRAFIEQVMANAFRGRMGQRLIGTTALVFDVLAEGATNAVEAAWVHTDALAFDAPTPLAHELSLPAYPGEDRSQHVGRLRDAWDTWAFAGDEDTLLGQLEAAGFPGAQIFHTSDPIDWSIFFLFFPVGTHTVTDIGETYGSFTWGDGTTYGPGGITPTQIQTLRAIVKKWKPGIWRCGGIIFQLSGWSYGSGPSWGDPGLVFGGENATIGAV